MTRLAATLIASVVFLGPSWAAPTSAPPAAEPTAAAPALQGWAHSVDELVDRFVSALRAKHADALQSLCVTETEYRDIILPGSVKPGEPPRTLVADWQEFLWGSLAAKNDFAVRDLLGAYGGKRLEVRNAAFAAPARQYAGYTSYARLDVTVVDDERGEQLLELGSVAKVGDRFKFTSYRRD